MNLINNIIDFLTSKNILVLNTLLTFLLFIKNGKDIYLDLRGLEIKDLKAIYCDKTLIITFKLLNLSSKPLHFTEYKFNNIKATSLNNDDFFYQPNNKKFFIDTIKKNYSTKEYKLFFSPMSPTVINPGNNVYFHFVFNELDKNNIPKELFLDLGLKTKKIKISYISY
ncbi:hypothetical protein [Streptobacillus canis]|uniref:hypothetical protein n=1 Tax=Streptobacillus canis TaxID=2678686 RepID=UPI0012E3007F|nr:hypothetical protein [Streptobacillus canis]